MIEFVRLIATRRYTAWHVVGPPWPHNHHIKRAQCGRKYNKEHALTGDAPTDDAPLCLVCFSKETP